MAVGGHPLLWGGLMPTMLSHKWEGGQVVKVVLQVQGFHFLNRRKLIFSAASDKRLFPLMTP